MGIDLSKLSAAPWVAHANDLIGGWAVYPPGEHLGLGRSVADFVSKDAAEFIALARNAFAGDHEALVWWEANRVKQ
jgi:hypothetical protein